MTDWNKGDENGLNQNYHGEDFLDDVWDPFGQERKKTSSKEDLSNFQQDEDDLPF